MPLSSVLRIDPALPPQEGVARRLDILEAKRPIQRRQAFSLIHAAGIAGAMGLPARLTWKAFDAPFCGKAPASLYLLREKNRGPLVGVVILWQPAIGECRMMHYGLDPRFRGKGYASEGVRTVLARALAEEGAPGVAAIIAHENEASRRVALAAGMVQMGPLNGATLFGITRPQMAPTPEAPVRSGPLRKAPSPIYRPILFRLAAYAWTVPYARRTLNWVIAAFMA